MAAIEQFVALHHRGMRTNHANLHVCEAFKLTTFTLKLLLHWLLLSDGVQLHSTTTF